jgi:hypothetical protein
MSAFALTRELRAFARLEGWQHALTPHLILRGSPKAARTSG